MDRAAPRILKSIVQTHGLAFTQSQALCKAYLADLMPNFREERQQLVAAVAYELPHKLLEPQTRQQRKALALEFGQASAIPPLQALQVVDAWFYALHESSASKQTPLWRYWSGWTSYLSGLLTGLIILLLGTAIAVYKKPETSTTLQQTKENKSFSASSALVTLTPTASQPVAHSPPSAQLALKQAQTTASLVFLPSTTNWTELDHLEVEPETKQTLLPFLFKDQYSSPTQHLPLAGADTKITQINAVPLKQTRNMPNPVTKTPLNKTDQSSPKASTAPKTMQPQKHSKTKPADVQKAFNQSSQAMQALAETILGLRKKQADRQAISNLLKLTGARFYAEQLTKLDQQIQVFNLRIDQLSATYSKQVAKLCELAPLAWQDEQLMTKKAKTQQTHTLLLRHWQACETLSSQQIKQQVLSYY